MDKTKLYELLDYAKQHGNMPVSDAVQALWPSENLANNN